MLNPWKRAREAEQRALVAEERAASLERIIAWMQAKVDESQREERSALKITCNVGYQAAWGFTPFPEASSIPPREAQVRELEEDENFDAVGRARADFKLAEMKRYGKMSEGPAIAVADEDGYTIGD